MPQIKGVHVSGYEVGSSIVWNQGDTLSFGTLWEDGSLVLVTAYPKLFAKIGYKHGGSPDGTMFRLPDDRGKVKRGQNAGSGNDPDAGSRGAPDGSGRGATGDNVGSIQGHATAVNGLHDTGHIHDNFINIGGLGGGPLNYFIQQNFGQGQNGGVAASAALSGDSESRMINLYCRHAIAYI